MTENGAATNGATGATCCHTICRSCDDPSSCRAESRHLLVFNLSVASRLRFLGLHRHELQRFGLVYRRHEQPFAANMETPRRHWREFPCSLSMQKANLL